MSSDANVAAVGSKPGLYLRRHRLRLSLWIALVEGFLVLVHVFPHLLLYALVVVSLLFWFGFARNYKSSTGRQVAWVFAASQSVAVLVPIVWGITKEIVAIGLVVAIAIAALVFLFAERERGHDKA